jgi:hypothetical protein
MSFDLTFYLVAFGGIVVHFFVRFRDSQTKNEKFEWRQNLLFTLYVTVVTMAMVTFRTDITNILLHTGVDLTQIAGEKLIWFFIGYFADSVWKNVENTGASILKSDTPPADTPPSV